MPYLPRKEKKIRLRAMINPVHDIPNHERPETWEWKPTITFWREGSDQLTDAAEIRKAWIENSENLAEPFRSALLSLPADAVIWCERLAQWPTAAWDNKRASVTLAGDAAHPMTYRKPISLLPPLPPPLPLLQQQQQLHPHPSVRP